MILCLFPFSKLRGGEGREGGREGGREEEEEEELRGKIDTNQGGREGGRQFCVFVCCVSCFIHVLCVLVSPQTSSDVCDPIHLWLLN